MMNDHRTPGQVAFERYAEKIQFPNRWVDLLELRQKDWEDIAAAVLAHAAPSPVVPDEVRRLSEIGTCSGAWRREGDCWRFFTDPGLIDPTPSARADTHTVSGGVVDAEPMSAKASEVLNEICDEVEAAAGGRRFPPSSRLYAREVARRYAASALLATPPSDRATVPTSPAGGGSVPAERWGIEEQDGFLWVGPTTPDGRAVNNYVFEMDLRDVGPSAYAANKSDALRVVAAMNAAAPTAPEPAEQPGHSAGDAPVTVGLDLASVPDRTAYAVVGRGNERYAGRIMGYGSSEDAAFQDYKRRVRDMTEERIKVTVHAPKGKRANVVMNDGPHTQCATVLPGQTQDFFVDRVRGVQVNEVEDTPKKSGDIPHHQV